MKVFTEEQRLPRWKLFLITGFLISLMVFLCIKFMEATIDKKAAVIMLVSILIYALLIVFVFKVKLASKINEQGIYYRFFPLHFKERFIPWNDLGKVFIRKYNPVLEYGGWGVRLNYYRKRGRAFNVSGNIGLQLILKNGKKILIGTHKEYEMKQVLSTYKDKIKTDGS